MTSILQRIFAKRIDAPVPAESYEDERRKAIPKELAQVEAALEIVDKKLERFWSGPDIRVRALRDKGASALLIENYPQLRLLDLERANLLRRRNLLLAERAHLL